MLTLLGYPRSNSGTDTFGPSYLLVTTTSETRRSTYQDEIQAGISRTENGYSGSGSGNKMNALSDLDWNKIRYTSRSS